MQLINKKSCTGFVDSATNHMYRLTRVHRCVYIYSIYIFFVVVNSEKLRSIKNGYSYILAVKVSSFHARFAISVDRRLWSTANNKLYKNHSSLTNCAVMPFLVLVVCPISNVIKADFDPPPVKAAVYKRMYSRCSLYSEPASNGIVHDTCDSSQVSDVLKWPTLA